MAFSRNLGVSTTHLIGYLAVGLAAALPLCSPTHAADWPHFRGPAYDNTSPERNLLSTWPQEGPKTVWKIPLGEGFSQLVVSKGRVFCFVKREQQELCVAMDPKTGQELWATPIDQTIMDGNGNGPRSTPAADGDNVYLLSTYLKLACVQATDGKVVWTHDLKQEYGGTVPGWGNASSPAIDGNLVFVCSGGAGQSLLAFDKKTGGLVWKGQDDGITHATPTPATILGVRQVIFRTGSGVVAVAPKTGEVLWRYAIPHKTSSAASPVVGGDMVYVSSSYGVGAGVCRVTKTGHGFAATELWRTPGGLENHWTTPAYRDGYLYGLYKNGPALRCIEMATGKEVWTQGGFGWGGATILVDGHVLVQDDKGTIVLIEATPTGYHEVARTQPLGGKCWTMPSFSGGRIYARSTTEAVCLDVLGKP